MKKPIDLEGIRALVTVVELICDTGKPSDIKQLAKTNASTISNLCDEVERLQGLLDMAVEDMREWTEGTYAGCQICRRKGCRDCIYRNCNAPHSNWQWRGFSEREGQNV